MTDTQALLTEAKSLFAEFRKADISTTRSNELRARLTEIQKALIATGLTMAQLKELLK